MHTARYSDESDDTAEYEIRDGFAIVGLAFQGGGIVRYASATNGRDKFEADTLEAVIERLDARAAPTGEWECDANDIAAALAQMMVEVNGGHDRPTAETIESARVALRQHLALNDRLRGPL